METLSVVLLCWAIVLLVFVLLFCAASRKRTPRFEPRPTALQVQGVIEVYEILGMYEGTIQ